MLGQRSDFRTLGLFGLRDFSRQLEEFRRDWDRLLFEHERGGFGFGTDQPAFGAVSDEGSAWVLRAELPGLSEKDVELTVNSESVTLRAERKVEQPAKHTVHRRERPSYRVARTFTLGTKIDPERVEATMKHGVLTVRLPKAAEAQPRKIQVRAS
jgi:HSP20 family molecular chaperone IbpA